MMNEGTTSFAKSLDGVKSVLLQVSEGNKKEVFKHESRGYGCYKG